MSQNLSLSFPGFFSQLALSKILLILPVPKLSSAFHSHWRWAPAGFLVNLVEALAFLPNELFIQQMAAAFRGGCESIR